MVNELIKWGFLIYLGITPLIPDTINSKYRIMDIFLVLLVCVYLINMLVNYERRNKLCNDLKSFFKDSIVIFMLLLIAIMGVSTIYSTDKSLAIQETIRFGTYIAILYYFISEIHIKKDIKRIINFIYCPAFVVGIVGIVQYFTKIGIEVNTNGALRIESTLGHPNSLGVYFVLLIFPLIPLIFAEKVRIRKVLYCLLLLIMVFNIGVCLSRNSWLALGSGIILLAIVYNWKILFGLIIAAVGALLTPTLRQRLMEMGMSVFNDGRLKHWAVAIEMFKDKPLTGVGNGNYVTLHSKYLEKYPQYIVLGEENFPTHNSYLKILSELGIIGFIPFLLMHVLIIIKGIKVCYLYDNRYKGVLKGIVVSLVIFLQVNLLDNMWFVPKVTTIYWILVGIIMLLYRRKTKSI